MRIKIPTWDEADNKIQAGTATPLDTFVFNNEPAGEGQEKQFRKELQEMINYVFVLDGLEEFDRED